MSSTRRSLVRRVNKRDANRIAYRSGFCVFLPMNATKKPRCRSRNIIVKREQEDPSTFAQRFSRSYRLLHLIACRVLGDEEIAPLAIKKCWRSASHNPPTLNMKAPFEVDWSEFSSMRLWRFSGSVLNQHSLPKFSEIGGSDGTRTRGLLRDSGD